MPSVSSGRRAGSSARGRARTDVAALVVALVAAVVGLLGAKRAQADDAAIAVLPLTLGPNVPAGRPALEAAVAKGAAVAARPVLGPDEVTPRLAAAAGGAACDTAACYTGLGRALQASHLIQGAVERREGQFRVRLSLIDAGTGRVLATEQNQCDEDDCSVAELCRLSARELVRQTVGPPLGQATPAPRPAPAPDVTATPPPPARESRPPLWERAWPIASIVGGVAALAVGAFVLGRHGDCLESGEVHPVDGPPRTECLRERNTLWGGLGWAGAGAVLTTVGVVFTIRHARMDSGPALAALQLGPRGLVLAGHF